VEAGPAEACAAHARLGPASLVLYDVSTLYFEADRGDGFREPGFPGERRLEPQITIGLLAGQDGFPLMVSAFEGNRAETKTMLPVIEAFMAAHQLPDVTVVADAGMISEANQKAIETAGLSFILGMKIPDVPYQVAQWKREHPGEDIPDRHVFTQPWPAGPSSKRRDQMIYYQFRADRARRTLRGIDEQVAKAAKAVAGLAPVKRNRFIALDGATKSINRELEARARDLAGLKGYVTNLAACPDGTPVTADFVIGSYHQLWNIEKSFRMSKSDLRARPIYHRKRDSIEAHLTIVFAALAITRFIENRTGWSIRKFVRTARRYRTIQIRAGQHTLTAEDPLPHGGAYLSLQQKRLSDDTAHGGVEVSAQQPGELQPRFIDHVTAFGHRPIGSREVPLAMMPSECSPRRCRREYARGRLLPGQTKLGTIGRAPDGNAHRLLSDHTRHAGAPSAQHHLSACCVQARTGGALVRAFRSACLIRCA
jgi:hypothetical protein